MVIFHSYVSLPEGKPSEDRDIIDIIDKRGLIDDSFGCYTILYTFWILIIHELGFRIIA